MDLSIKGRMPKTIPTSSPSESSDSVEEVPLRICIVIAGFTPFVGGGERHAHLLGRQWARHGHEVTVLTRQMKKEWLREEQMDGMRVCRVSPTGSAGWGKYAMLPFAMGWMTCHRKEYDVVVVCAFRVLGWLGVWGKCLGKTVWMRAEAHGEWSGEFIWADAGRKKSSLLRKLLFYPYIAFRNLCFRSVDAIVAISRGIRQEIESGPFTPKRILEIPNGMDMEYFSPGRGERRNEMRESLGWSESDPVFAYSGKLIHGKGLEVLLEAWTQVMVSFPSAKLLLIGSGEGQTLSVEQDLRKVIEVNDWVDSVKITGYVENVPEWLGMADIFVFPSHKESFGLSPMEAMACGLPVIATRSGGVEEFLEDGENAVLVDVGDRDSLAQDMLRWLKNPEEAARYGEYARKSVVDRFSIEQVAKMHEAAF
jgi:glycosyltransferase involved in cell wall biosynthesis